VTYKTNYAADFKIHTCEDIYKCVDSGRHVRARGFCIFAKFSLKNCGNPLPRPANCNKSPPIV